MKQDKASPSQLINGCEFNVRQSKACPDLANALSRRWTTEGLVRERRVLGSRGIAGLASNLRQSDNEAVSYTRIFNNNANKRHRHQRQPETNSVGG